MKLKHLFGSVVFRFICASKTYLLWYLYVKRIILQAGQYKDQNNHCHYEQGSQVSQITAQWALEIFNLGEKISPEYIIYFDLFIQDFKLR